MKNLFSLKSSASFLIASCRWQKFANDWSTLQEIKPKKKKKGRGGQEGEEEVVTLTGSVEFRLGTCVCLVSLINQLQHIAGKSLKSQL